jgi:hypothetical protein
MPLAISIIKAIVGYFILMFVGTNLIGAVVRGIVQPSTNHVGFSENVSEPKSIGATVIFSLISIAYLYALYHFWNIGVVIAAIMVMISRIPDLIFEIKTGQKINLKNMPKRPIDILWNIIGWLALPMLWYAFYFLPDNI